MDFLLFRRNTKRNENSTTGNIGHGMNTENVTRCTYNIKGHHNNSRWLYFVQLYPTQISKSLKILTLNY